jgi:hypothetical protein
VLSSGGAGDGLALEIPLSFWSGAGVDGYVADHPKRPDDLNVTELRFHGDIIGKPIRFILESFNVPAGEEGRWTLTIRRRKDVAPDYQLQYFATKENGKPVRHGQVFRWDRKKQEMVGD